MGVLTCRRCHHERESLAKPPFRGPLGEEVHASICSECWKAWLEEQTIRMNESRLNLAKAEHVKQLTELMKTFLGLAGEPPPDAGQS